MNQQLKQRLVGAVVLVSLAVIFIPIILEGPDDEWSPHTQGMPEPPQIVYHEEADVELPLPVEEPPEEASPAPGSDAAGPRPPVDTGAAAAQPSPVSEPAVVAPQPTPQPTPPPAPVASGDWVIQVGRFSQRLNAQGLQDRLKKAGYAAFLREDKAASAQSWQVLVGPLKTRDDAEKIRDELASKRQLKGFVIQNKG